MNRGLVVAILWLSAMPALAQTPREAPQDGYGLHDERTVGPFTIQRWVNAAMPEVSPAGMCDCLTRRLRGRSPRDDVRQRRHPGGVSRCPT